MAKVLNVPKRELAVFTTFHPTSSEHPWRLHPHVELIWAHARVNSEGIHPLKLHESGILSGIELDYLKDIWAGHYPKSTNMKVEYLKELKFGKLRYLVRPMAEDVYHAIRNEMLSADETGTIPAQAELAFREDGGVIFWKGYHRVLHFGAFANNCFGKLMKTLYKRAIVPPKATDDCPCCEDGKLTLERDENGPVTVSLSPYHEPEVDHIMFTTWKSNSQKEN